MALAECFAKPSHLGRRKNERVPHQPHLQPGPVVPSNGEERIVAHLLLPARPLIGPGSLLSLGAPRHPWHWPWRAQWFQATEPNPITEGVGLAQRTSSVWVLKSVCRAGSDHEKEEQGGLKSDDPDSYRGFRFPAPLLAIHVEIRSSSYHDGR